MSISRVPLPAFITPPSALPAALSTGPTKITIHPEPSSSAQGQGTFWSGKDGPSFGDILDIINPLQHIPLISTLYQAITGDTASPASNILGGLLFGGPIGLAAGIANEVVQDISGKDITGNVVAALTGNSSAPADKALAERRHKEDVALALLDATSRSSLLSRADERADEEEENQDYGLSATISPAQASAAYKNAQEAILSIFEPEALAAKY